MFAMTLFDGNESHNVGIIEKDGARYWSAQDLATAADSKKRVRAWVNAERTTRLINKRVAHRRFYGSEAQNGQYPSSQNITIK